MGIYTDYGRFVKAKQFKKYCESEGGIWFLFSMGSPRWDVSYQDSNLNYRPDVPTSAPTAFTSLYRWFSSYKEGDLLPQEYSLLDRSFIIQDDLTPVSPIPTDQDLKDDAETVPSDDYAPSISKYIPTGQNIQSYLWDQSYIETPIDQYQSPFIPPVPVSYSIDWMDKLTECLSHYNDFSNLPDPSPEEYEVYAYAKHFQEGSAAVPLGFLAMKKASVYYVEPVEDPDTEEGLKIFKYGSHYWRIVPLSEISPTKLPHHLLITVNVFPNDLNLSTVVEQELLVRQLTVAKLPVLSDLDGRTLLRRSDIVFSYDGFFTVLGRVKIPFLCTETSVQSDSPDTMEILINDFFTGRKRDVQQTDRYGYIIGF